MVVLPVTVGICIVGWLIAGSTGEISAPSVGFGAVRVRAIAVSSGEGGGGMLVATRLPRLARTPTLLVLQAEGA